MNPEYLGRLAQTPEERREVLASIGLLDTTDEPPSGATGDLLRRMEDMGLLLDILEPLDAGALSLLSQMPNDAQRGVVNCAALFIGDGPRFAAGLVRDLEELVKTGAPCWQSTALGTLFDSSQGQDDEGEHAAVEVISLNEEQRQAVRQATYAPMTIVTGPPGTGKSQIVVSLVADAYMHGKPVLFTSKNNKAVNVVESRVANLAPYPLMIRTGSWAGARNFRVELAQRLAALLAMRPSKTDHQHYEELKARYEELQRQQHALWGELQKIRLAHEALRLLDEPRRRFSEAYTPAEWEALEGSEATPDASRLAMALRLVEKYVAEPQGLLDRLLRWLSGYSARARAQSVITDEAARWAILGPSPAKDSSWLTLKTWLLRAISTPAALEALTGYQRGLSNLHQMMPRDEIARSLRQLHGELVDAGAHLLALYAKLAPDRLKPVDREAIGSFRALQERLSGD